MKNGDRGLDKKFSMDMYNNFKKYASVPLQKLRIENSPYYFRDIDTTPLFSYVVKIANKKK